MGTGERWRWVLLAVATAALTVPLALARLPSPALFAGLIAATALALAGRAPAAVPHRATTLAQAVIGVVIGVLAQPSTLANSVGFILTDISPCCSSRWGRSP